MLQRVKMDGQDRSLLRRLEQGAVDLAGGGVADSGRTCGRLDHGVGWLDWNHGKAGLADRIEHFEGAGERLAMGKVG
jgi:hypothetical protein